MGNSTPSGGKGSAMRTLLLALPYDGACFHGWQMQ